MVDRRLSERHFRTLAVVAAHDRLGRNGIGCWASHERLAVMVGCNYNRLSMNLRELTEFGYILRLQHPLNKRLRVYRVIYTIADDATMKGIADRSPSGEVSLADSSPNGDVAEPDSSPTQTGLGNNFKELSSVNIFSETENISCRSSEIHSPEGALPGKKNIGAVLAKLERHLKARSLPSHELPMWRDYLDQLVASLGFEDANYGRAQRLHDEIEGRMQ